MRNASLSRRRVLGAALAAVAPIAFGQEAGFPDRPIRFIVGYAAGGGVDTMARILAQRLSAVLGQSVIVENRGGVAGMIAADAVARSPADGYTLLYGESALLIAPQLQKTQIDPLKAFAPVAGAFQSRLMIVANNKVPASNPKELIALLKDNPGRYSYGTSGVGTVHHLGFELMKARADVSITHIPYRGASQIIPNVINGELAIGVVSAATAIPQARSGRLKAIASMSTTMPGAEDVPLVSEVLPGFDVAPRQMLLAPAGTPAQVVERLSAAVRTVLARPELAQSAAQQGVTPAYMAPDALARDLERESSDWSRVIKAQKIKAE